MSLSRHSEIDSVVRVLSRLGDGPSRRARDVRALLRQGAGEEELLESLHGLVKVLPEVLVPVVRDLIRIGVRPAGRYRLRKDGPDVCTICEREVPFCWGCRCGFRICQVCLEENRWGITCNNITWECPDCGGMRSF